MMRPVPRWQVWRLLALAVVVFWLAALVVFRALGGAR